MIPNNHFQEDFQEDFQAIFININSVIDFNKKVKTKPSKAWFSPDLNLSGKRDSNPRPSAWEAIY